MNIALTNLGCKVNYADLSQIQSLLAEKNFSFVSSPEAADVILINTCAVTNQAEAQARQTIRKIRNKAPQSFIIVLGCYAQLSATEIIETTGADAVFGTKEKYRIPELIPELVANKSKRILVSSLKDSPFYFASSMLMSRTRVFIKLQDGCSYQCSFCIVPIARGRSRSYEFDMIPEQINLLIGAGYKEIVVSGVNLSDYHSSDNKKFIDLLRLFDTIGEENIATPVRFRISSIEPQVINEAMIELIANSRHICPYFHIPLQSGSDKILKAMKRRYNTMQFQNKIALIRKWMPYSFIGLDVIAGFPAETIEDLQATKDFINGLDVSSLHCFPYSRKQGTAAWNFSSQITNKIKKQRASELLAISEQKEASFLIKNIGSVLSFLPETYCEKDRKAWGYTENYLRVGVECSKKLKNDFYKVRVNSENFELLS